MQVYKINGYVTLNRVHPSLVGGRLLTAEAYGPAMLGQAMQADIDTIVVWDDQGASLGSFVAVSDGAEAAQPFRPEQKPIDAYCAAILDSIHIDPQVIKQL